ncbi:MAG TPA: hypothetical protein DDZ51_17360 [Planctomycetaceae bacterium]|nr:hypothetical protein [Planctomycetaceae bacterium]
MHYRSLFDQLHIDANLYQCNESMVASPLFRVIQNCFPTIASFLIKVKSMGHEALARMLQTLESELTIDRLGCSLMAVHPNYRISMHHLATVDALGYSEKYEETLFSMISLCGNLYS